MVKCLYSTGDSPFSWFSRTHCRSMQFGNALLFLLVGPTLERNERFRSRRHEVYIYILGTSSVSNVHKLWLPFIISRLFVCHISYIKHTDSAKIFSSGEQANV